MRGTTLHLVMVAMLAAAATVDARADDGQGPADELSALRAENTLLKEKLKQRDEDNAALQKENRRLARANVTLRKENAAHKRGETVQPEKVAPEQDVRSADDDRFAKQRAERQAAIVKRLSGLRKAMRQSKQIGGPIAIAGIGTIIDIEWLELERDEIKRRPREWAPAVQPTIGSVGRFWRCTSGNVGRDTYLSAGNEHAHSVKVVQIVDRTNMITTFGSRETLIWIAGVNTSTFADGQWVHLPGIFSVTGNKTYATVLGGTSTVLVFEAAQPRE